MYSSLMFNQYCMCYVTTKGLELLAYWTHIYVYIGLILLGNAQVFLIQNSQCSHKSYTHSCLMQLLIKLN